MTPFVTMRRALSDTDLLGAALGGDSWLPWRILLIAAMGEGLTDEERAIFTKLTEAASAGRASGVAELWCIIGRRGGESRAIAALLVYLATMVDYSDPAGFRRERRRVVPMARTQEQAPGEIRSGMSQASSITRQSSRKWSSAAPPTV